MPDIDSDGGQGSSADGIVGFALSSLGYAVARHFRATLAPLSLEPREFALLRAVAAAEGQTQQALGDRLQIPASRMVAFVDALEERELLERRPYPNDRRAKALYLTAEGSRLLDKAFGLAIEFEQRLCADFTSAERRQLLDLLQRAGAQLGLQSGVHAAHAAHADGCDAGHDAGGGEAAHAGDAGEIGHSAGPFG